jgi:hypothetical protein
MLGPNCAHHFAFIDVFKAHLGTHFPFRELRWEFGTSLERGNVT